MNREDEVSLDWLYSRLRDNGLKIAFFSGFMLLASLVLTYVVEPRWSVEVVFDLAKVKSEIVKDFAQKKYELEKAEKQKAFFLDDKISDVDKTLFYRSFEMEEIDSRKFKIEFQAKTADSAKKLVDGFLALNKQYDHKRFSKMMQQAAEKKEKISKRIETIKKRLDDIQLRCRNKKDHSQKIQCLQINRSFELGFNNEKMELLKLERLLRPKYSHEFQVVGEISLSDGPIYPNKSVFGLLGLLAGGVLSCMWFIVNGLRKYSSQN